MLYFSLLLFPPYIHIAPSISLKKKIGLPPLTALFKSVILFNRFKKCYFLNRFFLFNKKNLQGGILKKIFYKGVKQNCLFCRRVKAPI
jgi:hypothetical protein